MVQLTPQPGLIKCKKTADAAYFWNYRKGIRKVAPPTSFSFSSSSSVRGDAQSLHETCSGDDYESGGDGWSLEGAVREKTFIKIRENIAAKCSDPETSPRRRYRRHPRGPFHCVPGRARGG